MSPEYAKYGEEKEKVIGTMRQYEEEREGRKRMLQLHKMTYPVPRQ